VPDQRGERRSPGGYRTSVLGRVDWACWLAAVGFLFLTVVSVLVQFAILGVITAILAVGIVAFDSWVNRPKGLRAARATSRQDTGGGRGTGWQANSDVNSRAHQPFRTSPRPTTTGQPQRHQPPPRPLNGQPPRPPVGQPQRQQPRQQPPRQPPPQGQPPMGQPPQGQPPQGQPPMGQPPQGQPQRPPFRPSPPDPGRARR
jgi:hypothetical protein